jgi:hypothetical protein
MTYDHDIVVKGPLKLVPIAVDHNQLSRQSGITIGRPLEIASPAYDRDPLPRFSPLREYSLPAGDLASITIDRSVKSRARQGPPVEVSADFTREMYGDHPDLELVVLEGGPLDGQTVSVKRCGMSYSASDPTARPIVPSSVDPQGRRHGGIDVGYRGTASVDDRGRRVFRCVSGSAINQAMPVS